MPKFQSTMAIFTIGCAVACPAQAVDDVVSYPGDVCHLMTKNTQVYASRPKSTFLQWSGAHSKADIVCVAREILVDKPLRSNGGDVVMYAEKIVLRSPIDSRVYIDAKSYKHLPDVQTSGNGRALWSPSARPLFDDYYTRSPQAVTIGGKHYLPELISGTTESFGGSCEPNVVNGTSPPDEHIDFANMKSGNIYLFATEVVFGVSDEEVSVDDADPLSCATTAKRPGVFLLADGARGGRGGAGHLNGPYRRPGETAKKDGGCIQESYERIGGLNTPGGRGADAGNIYITLIGGGDLRHAQAITTRSSTRGGPGGSTKKLRTPPQSGPLGARTPDVCAFVQDGEWAPAATGRPGSVHVTPASTSQGFISFYNVLSTKDASFAYDINELSHRAFVDPRITSVDFSNFVEERLYKQLRDAQSDLLELLNEQISKRPVNAKQILPRNLWNLDVASLETRLLNDQVVQVLIELSRFDAFAREGVINAYFRKKGGALNLRDSNIAFTWAALLGRTEAAVVRPTLAEIKAALQDQNLLLNSISEALWTAEFKTRLAQLLARLQAVEKELKLVNGPAKLQRIGTAVGGIVEGVMQVYAGYQAGQGMAAAAGIAKIASSAQELDDAINAGRDELNEREALRTAIEELNLSFRQYLRDSSRAKERFLRQYARALVDYLSDRSAVTNKFDVRGHLYGDLLAASLMSYFGDPSRDERELTFNLRSLYRAVNGKIDKEASFRLRYPLTASCYPGDTKCSEIPALASPQVVKLKAPEWYDGLPIFVVAPTRTPSLVPNFGEELRIEPAPERDRMLRPPYRPLGTTPSQ